MDLSPTEVSYCQSKVVEAKLISQRGVCPSGGRIPRDGECALVEAERNKILIQFPELDRNNVGVYNNVLSSATSDEAKVLYE